MYDILNVAYGVPWTKEANAAYAALEGCSPDEFDYDTLDQEGEVCWNFFYHGASDETPGFFGKLLDDMPSWETTPARCKPDVPPAVHHGVMNAWEKLPAEIRALSSPELIHVWSTS